MMTGGAAIGARGVLADPPEPAHRHSTVGQATPGTSNASPTWADLFDRAYDPGTGIADQAGTIAMFADYDAQTAALGLTTPAADASDDEIVQWTYQMPWLAMPSDYAFFNTPEWKEYTGFNVAQVSQTIEIGQPPEVVTLYAGAFDRKTVIDTWAAADYRKIEDDGEIAIYSFSEDDSFSPGVPLQRMFFARRNNAAIIGSDLVIFAPTLDLLRDAVSTAAGDMASLGEVPSVAALTANTPQLASCAIVSGSSIQTLPIDINSTPDEIATAIAEQQTQDQVPPILLAIVGITPGGPLPFLDPDNPDATPEPTPETATMELSLLMLTQEMAQQAIDIAGERLETAVSLRVDRPFKDLFASWELSVAEDAPVARLSFTLQDTSPNIWTDMLFNRDFPFLS